MYFKIGTLNKSIDIEKILFYLCIILYTLFSDDNHMIFFSKLVLFNFFLVELLIIGSRRCKVYFGTGAKISTIFVIICIFSYIWSYNKDAALGAILTEIQLVIMFLFMYWYFFMNGEIDNYLKALFYSGIALSIYTMIKYNGPIAFLTQMLNGYRMGGIIQNENTFGLNFTYAYIAALFFYNKKKKKIYLFSIFIFAFFALSSGSKKAVVILILGFIGILSLKYGIKRLYKIIIPIILFIIIAILILQSPYFSVIENRLFGYITRETISDNAREAMRSFGIEMILKRPILGWGLRGFEQLYPTRQYSHDNFVEVAVSLGVVGFITYYLLYVIPILVSFKNYIYKKTRYSQAYLVLLFLYIIDLIFGYGMVQFYVRNSWILIAIVFASYEKYKYRKKYKVIMKEGVL